jgi:hypothetical protein
VVIEPVPGRDFEAELGALGGRLDHIDQGAIPRFPRLQIGVDAGVDLDLRDAEAGARFDLARVGIDEDRYPDPGLGQRRDVGHEVAPPGDDVQPAGRGQLLGLLRDQADGVGLDREGDFLQIGRGCHLERYLGLDDLAEHPQVAFLDMPPVAPEVGRDPGRAGLLGEERGQGGLGLRRPAGFLTPRCG